MGGRPLSGLLTGLGSGPFGEQLAMIGLGLYYGQFILEHWLVRGLLIGLPLALLGGLIGWLGGGLLTGLLGGPLLALICWLPDDKPEEILEELLTGRRVFALNEGIRRYITNGLLAGLLRGGLLTGLSAWLIGGLLGGMTSGLLFGLLGGLFYGLLGGLFEVVQHYILRLRLSRAHRFPWKAVPFLEDATARIFLRRIGGGYSFMHRLLLDYFADLDAQLLPAQGAAQTNSTSVRTKVENDRLSGDTCHILTEEGPKG